MANRKKSGSFLMRWRTPAAKSKRAKRSKSGGSRISWRGFFKTAVIFTVIALVGSFYMRMKVVQLVRERAIQSSAVVVSAPMLLRPGVDIEKARVMNRLQRLRYQEVDGKPGQEGQYSVSKNRMLLFLRGAVVSDDLEQKPQLVDIKLDSEGVIEQILDAKFRQAQRKAWLEPEILAQLGKTETRATTPKRLKDFGVMLPRMLLAVEDERFRYHFGIDPVAIIRAVFRNMRAGKLVQGGSTVTQQLAKNMFYGSERTVVRKVREALSALFIETAFSKDQILELYLNEVFLGQEGRVAIHGFGEAAQSFFGKDIADLSIAETATLVGMVKAPSAFSPRFHPEQAKERRIVVLEKLLEDKLITEAQFKAASKADLSVKPSRRAQRMAPYFVDYLTRRLSPAEQDSGLDLTPMTIHTGIDAEYQRCAQRSVIAGVANLLKTYPRLAKRDRLLQSALIAVDPPSGAIVSWVGGRDYSKNQYDRISLAKRQPGSAFKPFVYLTALDRGLNNYRVARTTSLLADEPLSVSAVGAKTWEPQNYDKQYRGDVTFRQALAMSLNIPTVQIAMKVGIDRVARTAELFGFGSDLPQVPSLALGAGEVTPLEMAQAYAVIANGGIRTSLRPILSVTRDARGEVVYESDIETDRIASEQATFVLTDMLRSVIENGTARGVRSAGFTAPVAGKTGTTNDARDAWFAAFTPHLLAVVWVGFDDNSELGLTGGQAAVPIWTNYMKCVQDMEPQSDFVTPSGVIYRKIDLETGLLATEDCPADQVVNEVFVEGTEPISNCPVHSNRYRVFGDSEYERVPSVYREDDRPPQRTGVSEFLDKVFN